jgi:hypothetical protein
MVRINGDLIPTSSGLSHLGVDGGAVANAFDIDSISPFGHVHLNSGVFHHALGHQSGIIRYNEPLACFEVSVDGGASFDCVTTTATAGGVTSVGVIGGANLTGAVDFTSTSGFVVIGDTAGASPVTWDVDVAALSGLWNFPTGGFDRIPTCFNQSFSNSTSVTVTHNLNTLNVIVQVYDNSSDPAIQITPDKVVATDVNTTTISFNVSQTGYVVVMACEDS